MVSDAYDKLEQELRRGVVVLAVLSQLRTLRYGYELRQSLADQGMAIEEGTLYPLLRRLESQGVLRSEWRTTQGPPRRYYSLSEEGHTLYQRLTKSWLGLTDAMGRLLRRPEEVADCTPGGSREHSPARRSPQGAPGRSGRSTEEGNGHADR